MNVPMRKLLQRIQAHQVQLPVQLRKPFLTTAQHVPMPMKPIRFGMKSLWDQAKKDSI